jgi:hypothetical protein
MALTFKQEPHQPLLSKEVYKTDWMTILMPNRLVPQEMVQLMTQRHLQRAIDQLFLPWSSSQDADNYKKRIALKLSAGLYKITNSLKLPPYASIIGDGSDKTVINQTGVFPVLETINGEGIAAQTTSLNQATNIELKGLTLESNTTQPGLVLASCKNSSFTDINVKGPWTRHKVRRYW